MQGRGCLSGGNKHPLSGILCTQMVAGSAAVLLMRRRCEANFQLTVDAGSGALPELLLDTTPRGTLRCISRKHNAVHKAHQDDLQLIPCRKVRKAFCCVCSLLLLLFKHLQGPSASAGLRHWCTLTQGSTGACA